MERNIFFRKEVLSDVWIIPLFSFCSVNQFVGIQQIREYEDTQSLGRTRKEGVFNFMFFREREMQK